MKRKKGITAIEFLAVITIIITLFTISLTPIYGVGDKAERKACANNLKQYGLIFKMYANESQGQRFPTNARYVDASNWAMAGIDSASLYPEYLTDWTIMFCPADSASGASRVYSGDVKEGIEKAIKSFVNHPAEEEKVSMNYLLSMPVSYLYSPYSATTSSQVLEALLISGNIGYLESTSHKETGTYPDWTVHKVSDRDPKFTNDKIYEYHARNRDINFQDWHTSLGSHYISTSWTAAGHTPGGLAQEMMGVTTFKDDDEKTDIVDSMARVKNLREGIERFHITDINNVAGSAEAQSRIITMFDAFGADQFGYGSYYFHHMPPGSNVLYMDGHVEFHSINQGAPLVIDFGEIGDSYPAAGWMLYLTTKYFGGWG